MLGKLMLGKMRRIGIFGGSDVISISEALSAASRALILGLRSGSFSGSRGGGGNTGWFAPLA